MNYINKKAYYCFLHLIIKTNAEYCSILKYFILGKQIIWISYLLVRLVTLNLIEYDCINFQKWQSKWISHFSLKKDVILLYFIHFDLYLTRTILMQDLFLYLLVCRQANQLFLRFHFVRCHVFN